MIICGCEQLQDQSKREKTNLFFHSMQDNFTRCCCCSRCSCYACIIIVVVIIIIHHLLGHGLLYHHLLVVGRPCRGPQAKFETWPGTAGRCCLYFAGHTITSPENEVNYQEEEERRMWLKLKPAFKEDNSAKKNYSHEFGCFYGNQKVSTLLMSTFLHVIIGWTKLIHQTKNSNFKIFKDNRD